LLYGSQETDKSWVSIAFWFLIIWQKLTIKTGIFGSHPVSKSQNLKHHKKLERSKQGHRSQTNCNTISLDHELSIHITFKRCLDALDVIYINLVLPQKALTDGFQLLHAQLIKNTTKPTTHRVQFKKH